MKIINFELKSNLKYKNNIIHYFSYTIKTELVDVIQKNYRLIIYNEDYIWDSGIINTKHTNYLMCKNLKLKAYSSYKYKLFVETNLEKEMTQGKIITGIINHKNKGIWVFSNKENEEVTFEKKFLLPNYENAIGYIYVCTTGLYSIYINGEKINNGIGLSYSFSDEEIYSQEYIYIDFKRINTISIIVNPKIISNPGFTLQIRLKDKQNRIKYITSNNTFTNVNFQNDDLIKKNIYLYNDNYYEPENKIHGEIIINKDELIFDYNRNIFGKVDVNEQFINKKIYISNSINFDKYEIINTKSKLNLYCFRYIKILETNTLSKNDIIVTPYTYVKSNTLIIKSEKIELEDIIYKYYNLYLLKFNYDLYNMKKSNIYDYILINNNLLLKNMKVDFSLYGYCKYQKELYVISYYYSIYNYRKSSLFQKEINSIVKDILLNKKPDKNALLTEVFNYINCLKQYIFMYNEDNNNRFVKKCRSLIKQYKQIIKEKYITINTYNTKDLSYIYAYILNDDINNVLLNDILDRLLYNYSNFIGVNDELFSKAISIMIRRNNLELALYYIRRRYHNISNLNPYMLTELIDCIFGISLNNIKNHDILMIDIMDYNIKYISLKFIVGNDEIKYSYNCDNLLYLSLPVNYKATVRYPFGKIEYITNGKNK